LTRRTGDFRDEQADGVMEPGVLEPDNVRSWRRFAQSGYEASTFDESARAQV